MLFLAFHWFLVVWPLLGWWWALAEGTSLGESFEGLGPSSLLEGADAATLFCGEVQKEKCHPVLFQHQNILIILEFPSVCILPAA